MTNEARDPDTPRICVCVLMNHPFPANLPLLRAIYADRFSHVRFLIPFERLPDRDVITVYRGSYTHAAYLTDAARDLAPLDCDHYLVVHDDVLLNPRLSERTFRDFFPLGPRDGFIARVGQLPEEAHAWVWSAGLYPKLLYPKSILFGGGVEPANLVRYLPDPATIAEAMAASGIGPTAATRIDVPAMTAATVPEPSRLLLHGLSEALDRRDPALREIDDASLDAMRALFAAMLADQQRQQVASAGQNEVQLPLPMVTSGYVTDFYIIPKSGFASFCHYVGVASAANLFVEIMAPTLLYACCERVRTSGELGLDFSGFDKACHLHWFLHPNTVAIHPVKLSAFRAPEAQDQFMTAFRHLAAGESLPADSVLNPASFGRRMNGFIGDPQGWNVGEDWGVWSAAANAIIPVALASPARVRLVLQAPVGDAFPVITGCIRWNGLSEMRPLRFAADQPGLEIVIERLVPDHDGIGRIQLQSDTLMRPCDVDPGSADARSLGIALVSVEAIA